MIKAKIITIYMELKQDSISYTHAKVK